jgi:hypothetical protein
MRWCALALRAKDLQYPLFDRFLVRVRAEVWRANKDELLMSPHEHRDYIVKITLCNDITPPNRVGDLHSK